MMSFIGLFAVLGAVDCVFAAAHVVQKRHLFAIAAGSLQLMLQIEEQPLLAFFSHFGHE